ncbi:MAG: hypothetical protein GXP40_13115 [Chloroflexi bacterium]|nr:hypothetical protein [Chloroflexota bacterium]
MRNRRCWGRGAGFRDQGRGWGRGQGQGWGPGAGWNQPLSALYAGIDPAEKKSWLENFKEHLTRRMSEVDEALEKL